MKIPFATPWGTLWRAVTGVDAAWTIAFAFMLKAIPAIVLARASWSIAAGSRSATAARRLRPIILIAAMVSESSSGSLPVFTYDSTECANASAAVAAITAAGADSTSSGSTSATEGASLRVT